MTPEQIEAACENPGLAASGRCCGKSPCIIQWYRPCDEQGGCWDRATCNDCSEPIVPGHPHYDDEWQKLRGLPPAPPEAG